MKTEGHEWLESAIRNAYRKSEARARGKIDGRGRPRLWEPYVSEVMRLAAEDKTVKEIAKELEIGEYIVRRCCQFSRVKPRRGYQGGHSDNTDERTNVIKDLFLAGATLQEVGDKHGISRERVRQILKRAGVPTKAGGKSKKAADNVVQRKTDKDARSMEKYGLPWNEYLKHRGKKTARAYTQQKSSAQNRGIPFELSFGQWLRIWVDSGKLEQRGTGKESYVMSRKGDAGGYTVDNVVIATTQANGREAVAQWLGKPKKQNPGVFCIYRGASKPWMAKVGKKSLGNYATEEEAVAARAAYLETIPSGQRYGKGYAIISRNGAPYRYQVMVGSYYVGSYKTPEEALAARAAYIAKKEQA